MILPLRRKLVFSALVIGALSPDLHYFLGFGHTGQMSHTIRGAFFICLPLALVIFCVFHWLLKLPLISLASEWHQARICRFATPLRLGPPGRFTLILASLLIGIFSHLLWDSFTHSGGWVVRHVAFLRFVPFEAAGNHRPVCNFLQFASTALGLLILALAYVRWSRQTDPLPIPDRLRMSTARKFGVITTIATLAGLLAASFAFEHSHHAARISSFLVSTSISFTTLSFLGLLVFSLYWHREMRPGVASPKA